MDTSEQRWAPVSYPVTHTSSPSLAFDIFVRPVPPPLSLFHTLHSVHHLSLFHCLVCTMFSKVTVVLAIAATLVAQAQGHAIISPALGVTGTPVRNDVQKPRYISSIYPTKIEH